MATVLAIAENMLLLGFMALGYFLIETSRPRLGGTRTDILNGLCFGLAAALVTAVPVTLGDGATVDARSGPVLFAGIVAGPIGAAIAALLGGISRGIVGGSFAFSGVIVYAVYALSGLALTKLRLVTLGSLAKPRSIAIALVTSALGGSAMFFLIRPLERAVRWARDDLPFIVAANSMSVLFTIAVVSLAVVYLRKSTEVIEVNERLNLAKPAGGFGVWDYDIEHGRLEWDDRSKAMHGVEAADFRGTYEDWARNVHPDDLERAQRVFSEALENGGAVDLEYRVLHPDGDVRWIKGDAIVLRNAEGAPVRVVGSNFDLTAIRRAEQELRDAQALAIHSQKVETVGQLTGGIAHDFNNLLAVIRGNLDLMKTRLEAGEASLDDCRRYVDDSIEAVRRGSELTQNMLAYARKAQLKPVDVNLNAVVRQTEKWISRTIGSRIEILLDLDADLKWTRADQGSLQGALVNLLLNARDAVSGSGRIRIRTANVRLDSDFRDGTGERLPAGDYVMLSVSDDGIGMDAKSAERIFDPFYTTKPIGEGTGLGLSTVHGFVRQSQGAVTVETASGRGTTFALYFPAIESPRQVAEIAAESAAPTGVVVPGTRILLVEDQPDVRNVIQKMLTLAGYEVVTAIDGDEALDRFRSDNDFDLIVSDIVMPGSLQGLSLAEAVREISPTMPFVFLTGFNSLNAVESAELQAGDICLEKPVSRNRLMQAIRDRLSAFARTEIQAGERGAH